MRDPTPSSADQASATLKGAKGAKKRHYTPQGLAAVLANLDEARRAPKAWVYRPTPERLLACYANLAKANAARQAFGLAHGQPTAHHPYGPRPRPPIPL